MNDTEMKWHSYENKQTRPIRVMVKNLHPSCDPKDISSELQKNGFKVLNVVNKLKKTTVNGEKVTKELPMFMITFDNKEDIKKIFSIQYLMHMKIKVEALRANKSIPQCKICQRFEHTQHFCRNTPKCVKCAGNHLTADCKTPANDKPQCANCGERHPANYRGCVVAKELQKRRDQIIKTKKEQPRSFVSKTRVDGISYNQVVQGNAQASQQQQQPEQQSILQMMQNLLAKVEEQNKTMNQLSERLMRIEGKYNGAVPRKNK